MPNLIRALGFSLLIMLSPHLFAAPERLALVIGNAAYAKPLKNPGNDADAMTAALQRAGFHVTTRKDLRLGEMKSAINDFGVRLNHTTIGLIYFAGHGVQTEDNRNYLLPIGADTDVPAGDIGVGGREIGYLFGQYKRLTNGFSSVLTGKGLSYGGSLIRPEATGYGLIYFTEFMLQTRGQDLGGKRVLISGSGNVAQYAAERAIQRGAKVLTVSDSGGFVRFADSGMTEAQLQALLELKEVRRERLAVYAKEQGLEFFPGKRPWGMPTDIALPCATQNELDENDAKTLLANGCTCVAEGANMPSTLEATEAFLKAGILYAPGKASNAGGVATSGLEMSQNAIRLSWTREEVDNRLHGIMAAIHESCQRYGMRADGSINYVQGANVAGFVKVADAMLAQGIV